MIEVEIRGELSREKFDELQEFFTKSGKLVEEHEREMIRIKGIKGSDESFVARDVDVRLRKTNDTCEFMIKNKASDGNVGREEISVPLAGNDLGPARELAKVFGCTHGVWMHRKKWVYRYRDIEWSLVEAPQRIYYYEAEQEVETQGAIAECEAYLQDEAAKLQLDVFTPEQTQTFIEMLNEKVNKEIEL